MVSVHAPYGLGARMQKLRLVRVEDNALRWSVGDGWWTQEKWD